MELSKNLLSLCKKKRLSLSALAKKSGVKQPTLHGWSTGRSVQNLDDLRKVCEVLEVGLYRLLFGTTDPYENKEAQFKELFQGDVRITIHRIEKEQ